LKNRLKKEKPIVNKNTHGRNVTPPGNPSGENGKEKCFNAYAMDAHRDECHPS